MERNSRIVCFVSYILYISQTSLDWLTEKIQKCPDISYTIERLVICYKNPDVDLSALLPLFPSIRTLLCSIGDYNNLIIDKSVHYTWSKHIKRIDDSSVHSIAYHLLLTTTCPNLTTLNITDYSQNIVPLLKNTPSLKRLSLGCGAISLESLEIIHQSAPYLESLVIQNLSVNISEIGDTIEPATFVTECTFKNISVSTFKIRIDLLIYIRKKYPGLSKLIYNVKDSDKANRDRTKLNNCGWIPLFQDLGSQLETFGTSDGSQSKNPFKELDYFGCRIKNLKIWTLPKTHLAKLEQSQQVFFMYKR